MSSFEVDKDQVETKLDELFELLTFAQLHLDAYGNPELTLETYLLEIQELQTICQDRMVHATSDTVFAPAIDEESGVISGAQIITGTAAGKLQSVSIATLPDRDGHEKQRIGIQLYYGQQKIFSPVGNQYFDYFTFIPVEGATFYVEPLVDQRFEPDPDDVICADIDEAILNDSINFERLVSLFETEMVPIIDSDGDEAPGLQHTYYMQYLNQIASFEGVTAIAYYGIQRTGNQPVIHQESDESFMLHGTFKKFEMLHITLDEQPALKLVLTAVTEEGIEISVVLDTITAIELH